MRVQSVRQSLLIYAIVVSLALGFAIITIASSQMLNSSRTAEFQAAKRELTVLVRNTDRKELLAAIRADGYERYDQLMVVNQSSTEPPLKWTDIQILSQSAFPLKNNNFVAVRIPDAPNDFLLGQLKPQYALRQVQSSIRFMLIAALVAAVLAGLLLGFLNNRIVVHPLSSLSELASAGQFDSFPLDNEQAPNEIAQVAQSFRRTVRRLEEERTELESKHRELHAAQEGLNRASKLASLGRIAAGVAHEIGNPLAAIKGYLSLVKRGLEPEEQEEVLNRCVAELDRIHDTIRQLLTYARRDDSAKELVEFGVEATIEDVLKLLRNHPELKGVEIEFKPELTENVTGLEEAFRQVVLNIMLNAGQALKNCPSPCVKIKLEPTARDLLIHISDNGPGIPKSAFDQIFDPFFTTKDPGEGTGLGLAVSRSLIEGMGGKLNCVSDKSQGAQFTIRLPKANPKPAAG